MALLFFKRLIFLHNYTDSTRLVRRQTISPEKSVIWELLKTTLGSLLLALFIMTFVARAFTVDGPSMMPTLMDGERLLVDKISYRFQEPNRGEIIVFRYPADPREFFIKRIVGVPGDEVAIVNGQLIVNGEVIEEDYINTRPLANFRAQTVPAGHYFVLGDNRNNSKDSRNQQVGFVPRTLIVGRAIWRYWPLNRLAIVRPPRALALENGGSD